MIKINLLPPHYRISRRPPGKFFAAGVSILLTIIAAFSGVQEYRIWHLRHNLETIRCEYQMVLPLRGKMDIANRKIKALRQKQGIIRQLSQDRKAWHDIFERVGMIVDSGIWLTEVSCMAESGLFIIKGEAASYALLADLMHRLGQDDFFRNPVLVNSAADTKQAINFEINVKVK